MSRVHTWLAFSNHTPGDGGIASHSPEAVHDEIHGVIGGQMGNPAVADTSVCSVEGPVILFASFIIATWTPECEFQRGRLKAERSQFSKMTPLTIRPVF